MQRRAADLFGQVLNDSVPIATIRSVINALLTLEAGITTVLDCGAASQIVIEIAKAVDRGMIDGPRVRAAGRVVTMTGGHGHFIGREVDGPVDVIGSVPDGILRTELLRAFNRLRRVLAQVSDTARSVVAARR